MAPVVRSLAVRFWAKVNKGDGCWEWAAGTSRRGYGLIRGEPPTGNLGAHRASWEMHFGPVPAGLLVCHRCDNRKCVRPDHLFLGTPADNMLDRDAKGRQARGAVNGKAVLVEGQVQAVRAMLAMGFSQRKVAKRIGTSASAVCHIASGKNWRHLG